MREVICLVSLKCIIQEHHHAKIKRIFWTMKMEGKVKLKTRNRGLCTIDNFILKEELQLSFFVMTFKCKKRIRAYLSSQLAIIDASSVSGI